MEKLQGFAGRQRGQLTRHHPMCCARQRAFHCSSQARHFAAPVTAHATAPVLLGSSSQQPLTLQDAPHLFGVENRVAQEAQQCEVLVVGKAVNRIKGQHGGGHDRRLVGAPAHGLGGKAGVRGWFGPVQAMTLGQGERQRGRCTTARAGGAT